MDRSRIPSFYRHSIPERLRLLLERDLIDEADHQALSAAEQVLSPAGADKMIENVIGVFGLPLGLGLNFLVNGRDYVVPMVVEEPSIVAALSASAKIVRAGGGFTCESTEAILMGQVQVVGVADPERAAQALSDAKSRLLEQANSLQPRLLGRGGGARDLEVVVHRRPGSGPDDAAGAMVVLHLFVDTCDAMGANLVNSMCEGLAPRIEELTGGKVFLRILSNLTDRARVRARAVIAPAQLATATHTGEQVRDGVILANDLARIDPYRAATHNKGIMNGVDAVAIATGNDWRAIEAAAHAYAARDGTYASLTRWTRDDAGALVGELDMPMKVGTVGGSLQSNPAVKIAHRILGIRSARELAEIIGAVGLAQNLAALRALATDGIQRGHMSLHARSVAATAGVPAELFDEVVRRLVADGDIKVWKAQQILEELQRSAQPGSRARRAAGAADSSPRNATQGQGYGKVVVLGEHAVVYGSHAIAAPIPLAVTAEVEPTRGESTRLAIPDWRITETLDPSRSDPHGEPDLVVRSLRLILDRLGLQQPQVRITVHAHVPSAMGLGASAAYAVAVIRALGAHFGLGLSDEQVNALAFESEKLAHGTPSGMDNALATYGKLSLYKKGEPPLIEPLRVPEPIPVVIGISGVEGLTARMVARVRDGWSRSPQPYERVFAHIDDLVLRAVDAIAAADLHALGQLMDLCHGLLNGLQVSSPTLEQMVQIARDQGALGAKLTGGGGGGSVVAVCPGCAQQVAEGLRQAGYRALITTIG